ncbi:sensor histidine kinase [Polyangium spumosum]|uniref:histidine kinase n=1 Tax=Polyangium spumosum TaxID=889282 RepID=A0A6N7Q227_9BACT|nr:ATP-binding protein [Polyangium spumosum]MRG97767.1 PAS domain-containing protein [Polyangium spumosum]
MTVTDSPSRAMPCLRSVEVLASTLDRHGSIAWFVDGRTFDAVWTSTRAAALFGHRSGFFAFLTPPGDEALRASLGALVQGAAPWTGDAWATTATGRAVFMRIAASVIAEDRISSPYVLVTMTDISDLAEAREALFLVSDVGSIVWEFDLAARRFTFVSRQAERILGYPVEEWLGDPMFWYRYMHPEDVGWAPAYCENETKRLTAHEFVYRMIAADGRVVWLRDIVTVVVEGNVPKRLRGVMVDVTASKQAEAERDRLLAEEQARRAELELARARMEDALRRRDEFLSAASHELRTPLTPLSLQIQSLLRDVERGELQLGAAQRKKIELADRQIERLSALVKTLLDVSRALGENLGLTREPCDLRELTREVLDELESERRRGGAVITLNADAPAIGVWDRAAVQLVITHLVRNAIKFGLGQPITLSLSSGDGAAKLRVSDGGMGIAPEDHERIFEPYERADAAKVYGGLGLGLHAARRIVEAHGGLIELRSAKGQGAEFTVTLPMAKGPAAKAAT